MKSKTPARLLKRVSSWGGKVGVDLREWRHLIDGSRPRLLICLTFLAAGKWYNYREMNHCDCYCGFVYVFVYFFFNLLVKLIAYCFDFFLKCLFCSVLIKATSFASLKFAKLFLSSRRVEVLFYIFKRMHKLFQNSRYSRATCGDCLNVILQTCINNTSLKGYIQMLY